MTTAAPAHMSDPKASRVLRSTPHGWVWMPRYYSAEAVTLDDLANDFALRRASQAEAKEADASTAAAAKL